MFVKDVCDTQARTNESTAGRRRNVWSGGGGKGVVARREFLFINTFYVVIPQKIPLFDQIMRCRFFFNYL